MNSVRKIALFGGTFDPVHLGHVHLARLAVEALELDEVRFIPCRISPHKRDRIPAPAEDRVKMLELATADLPWAVVDDLEVRRDGPSFSYQTAAVMAERFPGTRLFWIMGEDQWDALPRWAEPRKLAELLEFVVFSRSGRVPAPRGGFRAHFLTGGHPAMATAIREAVGNGEVPAPWLHPDVAGWIGRRGLYSA
jgi:nicotinate-nucleotide adenylyltransferase